MVRDGEVRRLDSALVVGASGQIGSWLLASLKSRIVEVTGLGSPRLLASGGGCDLARPEGVVAHIRSKRPSAVFLTAAISNVDLCENEPERTSRVNVEGTLQIARAAREVGSRFVFFSSDYVFDGVAGPYDEEASPAPLNAYGLQKLAAERALLRMDFSPLIIRTTVVFGREPGRKNFLYRLVDTLRDGRVCRVPSDQIGTPTFVEDLAAVCVELVANGCSGVFHVAGPDLVSRYEFALSISAAFGLDGTLIRPISTRELSQPARRPLRAGLVSRRLRSATSHQCRSVREALSLLRSDPF